MKKRTVYAALLTIIMVFSVCVFSCSAAAEESGAVVIDPRASAAPDLSFTGTTAHCSFATSAFGADIVVTLTLKHGSTVIDSWTDTATNYISVTHTATVVAGQTYTLIASGTINGKSFSSSTTATC